MTRLLARAITFCTTGQTVTGTHSAETQQTNTAPRQPSLAQRSPPLPRLRRTKAWAQTHAHDNNTEQKRKRRAHTILVRRGGCGDVLAEGGADFVEDVGVDGGEVARELVAHHRDVELVVDARAERVSELQNLDSRVRNRDIRSAPDDRDGFTKR